MGEKAQSLALPKGAVQSIYMVKLNKIDHQFTENLDSMLSGTDSRHLIFRATIAQAARRGVDHITVADVISEAGVSRNTLYSHFGDLNGVFAELWLLCGEQWFARLATTPVNPAPLSDIDHVLFSLLAIAPRSSEILEVVLPVICTYWENAATTPEGQLRIAWTVASHIGIHLTRTTTPNVLDVVDAVNASLTAIPMTDSYSTTHSPQKLEPDEKQSHLTFTNVDVDDVTNRLMSSTITVVGNVGLTSATLMRICRLAGVTTGSMTTRFSSLHELLDASFEAASTRVISDNALDLARIDSSLSLPESNALFVDLALGHERRWWRRYRTELLLSALNDPELTEFITRSMVKSHEILLLGMEHFGVPKEILREVAALNAVYAVGMAVLHEIGLPVKGLRHDVIIGLIFENLQNTTTNSTN